MYLSLNLSYLSIPLICNTRYLNFLPTHCFSTDLVLIWRSLGFHWSCTEPDLGSPFECDEVENDDDGDDDDIHNLDVMWWWHRLSIFAPFQFWEQLAPEWAEGGGAEGRGGDENTNIYKHKQKHKFKQKQYHIVGGWRSWEEEGRNTNTSEKQEKT